MTVAEADWPVVLISRRYARLRRSPLYHLALADGQARCGSVTRHLVAVSERSARQAGLRRCQSCDGLVSRDEQ